MKGSFFDGLCIGSIVTIVATLIAVTCVQNSSTLNLKGWNKVNTATELIEKKYYGDYTDEDIIDGILTGVCFNLDKYSAYLTNEDYEKAVDPDQKIGGIGIGSSYNKYTKVYKIIYCYDNTPASRAGLRRNDIIEAIDGYDAYSLEMDKFSELIRGEPGTTVKLKINRDGELLDFELVREKITIPYAYSYQLPDNIGFIKITTFEGDVVQNFVDALSQVENSDGLIIDLRGNTGGTVDYLSTIMSKLVPSGTLQTIVYKDGKRDSFVCTSDLEAPRYKFAVLCDEGTASCSESMTQALKDIADAIIVGKKTYGKGVVQEYFKLDKNSVLRLTTGYAESPNGVVWNEVGITPDIEVDYEYLGDDFEESDLMCDAQVLAAHTALLKSIKGA